MDIPFSKTIGHLKKDILAENPSLSITNAVKLRLFKANIPDKSGSIRFVFNNEKELLGSDKLSSVFEGDFEEGLIHIAVKQPSKWILSFTAEKANLVPQPQL